jgi:hypothetical protein
MQGYGKRFGADYTDEVTNTMVERVLTQAVFHQDPRYFYKGTGTFRSRVLYAFATAFVRKGDNGQWQPAYTDVLGSVAGYGIATIYRPETSRPGTRLYHTVLLSFGGNVARNLFQEFFARKVTTHVPNSPSALGPVLRPGTPVVLISKRDLGDGKPENAGPIEFTLASDLEVSGAVVATQGSSAWGRVTYSSGSAGGNDIGIQLEGVRLTVGKVEVPLRSTQLRGATQELEYHRLENSGRIVITLYVDKDTLLTASQ